ncbi:Protein kinase domain-containing protein [Halarsenatibacter silvermanii]|uniref:Protein kinase domain-containing protein n=1 Tax=Halarsenatibacter silvermanii TaxID=321763 RepID=A0A1G9I244_9FIRM|nr:Protein kinase domain-containing protein [Halarsenatibacter silvermanii]
MTERDEYIEIEIRGDKFYARPIFSGQQPRSRIMKEVVEEIEDELSWWPSDDRGVFMGIEGVIRHQGDYYLIFPEECRQEQLTFSADQKLSPELIWRWWRRISASLAEALPAEVEEKGEDIPLIKIEHLRWSEGGDIKLLPPSTADYLLLYSEDDRPRLSEESYRPPELISRERENLNAEKVAVFNLAVIIYYLLTGESPHAGRDRSEIVERVRKGRMKPVEFSRPELAEEFRDLLRSCLEAEPEKRPDFSELSRKLAELEEGEVVKSENEIDRDKLKRQHKIFNIKKFLRYQVRRKWPVMAVIGILMIGLPLFFFTAGPEEFITPQHEPEEVAEYYYQAVNEKNVNLLEDTTGMDLGELRRMVSETHVMETVQQFYHLDEIEENGEEPSEEDLEERLETLFGVEDLELEHSQEDPPIIEANYTFFFQREEEVVRWQAEDEIYLREADGRWQIEQMRGFMENVIQGELPRVEESED